MTREEAMATPTPETHAARRERIAVAMMAAMLSNPGGPIQANSSNGWNLVNCTTEDVASWAIDLTDALIAALEEGEKQ